VTEHVYAGENLELDTCEIGTAYCYCNVASDEFNKVMAGLLAVPHKELQDKQTEERQKRQAKTSSACHNRP
jgi:hypothetical protein